jgi:hypothetical protein
MPERKQPRALLEKASRTPWYYDGRDIFSEHVGPDGHRLVIPLPDTFHPSQAVNPADAELVVAAVNEYAERYGCG